MSEYSSIGKRPPRIEAADKVTGRTLYSADIILPNMLHGKALRSPYAHARIKRLDISKAQALDGVMAVITAKDVPALQKSDEVLIPTLPCLAKDKVVFAGQPVAVVAAVSPHIAEDALRLIDVEYEQLMPVTDVLTAIEPDTPLVYSNLYVTNLPERENRPGNIFWYMNITRGDIKKGFQDADIILENTFRTQTVHQGHLEPRASIADVSSDGKVTIWTDNQGIFKARDLIAEFLRVPLNQIKVMPVEVGGAFGGKEHQQLSPLCALLAVKTGRPVRMVMTREEVFKATRPAPATVINLKMGVRKDGYITSATARMIYDYGASTGMAGLRPMHLGYNALSPYRIPNLQIEYYNVVTNKPPSGPYRAPGAAQATFAVESHLDLLARELGIDPLKFRLKNAVAKGDSMVDGKVYSHIGFRETMEKMSEYLEKRDKPTGKTQGRGVACGLWSPGYLGSAAHININSDGSVVLVIGSTDLSGTRTAFAQIVAEEFAIPLKDVTVVTGDTETAPFSCISAGSMVTRSMGNAIYRACQGVKEQLCRRAAARMNVEPEDVEFTHAKFRLKAEAERYITLADLVRESFTKSNDGPVCGSGASELVGQQAPVFAVHAADVEIDSETGKVKVLSYVAAQDTGLSINPTLVEGQIQGAVVQGVGWALTEGYVWRDGIVQNHTFLDYRMPTAADVPFVETLLVEVNSEHTPYGIRGVGEPPIVPTLATIANAIHSATGVRLKELPMTPEAILREINQDKS